MSNKFELLLYTSVNNGRWIGRVNMSNIFPKEISIPGGKL